MNLSPSFSTMTHMPTARDCSQIGLQVRFKSGGRRDLWNQDAGYAFSTWPTKAVSVDIKEFATSVGFMFAGAACLNSGHLLACYLGFPAFELIFNLQTISESR